MTKEEWIIQLKEAQDNLNALVEEARSQNNSVILTVVTKFPLSMESLVSIELLNNNIIQSQPQIIEQSQPQVIEPPVISPIDIVTEPTIVNEESVI
jgi:hypothetical protein